MKLKEVTHTENFCGAETTDSFNIHSNRFVVFDRDGYRINECYLEKIPNYLDLEVLETKESGYSSLVYFVGFPTTHIKLDLKAGKYDILPGLKFGEIHRDYGH